MNDTVDERYNEQYKAAVTRFVQDKDICNLETKKICEPHLPLWGSEYESAELKLVFIGQDTKGWNTETGDIGTFIDAANHNVDAAIHRMQDRFRRLEFVNWGTNNFGKGFFDTVFKLLAAFAGMADWRELKRWRRLNPYNPPEILRSFLWANVNSIEKWNTARHKGANFSAWHAIKAASEKHLDSFEAILKVFRPDVAVITDWDVLPHYWGELRPQWEDLGRHVRFALISFNNCQTHVFQTAHPGFLSRQKIHAETIKTIIDTWQEIKKGSERSKLF
jgi:hypothetical protein